MTHSLPREEPELYSLLPCKVDLPEHVTVARPGHRVSIDRQFSCKRVSGKTEPEYRPGYATLEPCAGLTACASLHAHCAAHLSVFLGQPHRSLTPFRFWRTPC